MGLKQDEDFLRFITMGAAGSAHAARYLSSLHGHRMVELERYAMANKLWTTKLKRLRVPDLICLRCGLRVEARVKSKLEIKLSDSEADERTWDHGLRDRDVVALVAWNADTQAPRDGMESFTVGALRESLAHSKLGERKSASEGAERDRTWTARVPRFGGTVLDADPARGRVRILLDSGRRQTYRIDPPTPAYAYVEAGERVEGHERFVLGVVPPARAEDLDCPGPTWNEREDLRDDDPVTRYIAVKVAGLREDPAAEDGLLLISQHDSEARIRLEAVGSLARIAPQAYTAVLASALEAHESDGEQAMAMEAVLILSELGTRAAAAALSDIAARRELDSEIRSAAIWGLGVTGARDAKRLLPHIGDEDADVALHALAAMGPIPRKVALDLARMLRDESSSERTLAAAATLLAGQGTLGADVLLDLVTAEGRAGVWARAGLGQLPEVVVRAVANGRLTGALESALQPMWALNQSWLNDLQLDTPLRFLQRQTIRHEPSS